MKKNIIVTGASRGIGFETVTYLAKRDCELLAIARSEDHLSELKQKNPDAIRTLALDITKKEAPKILSDYLAKNEISIDGIIHNAGALVNKPFMDLTDEDWDLQLSVNFMAPVRLTRALVPHMNDDAHILNISSMGGFQGSDKFPGLSAYSCSKGALSILTECLAVELKEYKITSNCLCLGAVNTEMLQEAFPGIEAPLKPGEMAQFIGNYFLTASKFMNGQIIPVALQSPG